ncbi:MAG: PAC2 family protein [Dehalococcoidia bacterium]
MLERSSLQLRRELGELRDPIAILTFIRKNGYNSTAAATLNQFELAHHAEVVADIPPDEFYDFTVMPPTVRLVDDERVVDWPQNEVRLLPSSPDRPDILTLAGIEPHLRWPAFAGSIVALLTEHKVGSLVVLRTWPAPVPHTKPSIIRLTTNDEAVASRLGRTPQITRYEGPVDFGGLVSTLFAQSGGVTAGLGAIVPNYLGVVPNPFAMVALTEALDRIAGTETSMDELRQHADELRERANEEMERSSDLRRAVEQMEDQYDSVVAAAGGGPTPAEGETAELPAPDELLRDIEQFLRGSED